MNRPICLSCWREEHGLMEDPGPPSGSWEKKVCGRCGCITTYGLEENDE